MKSALKEPLVSIVIPAHNCLGQTLDCINSLKCMTYSNFNIIVIDDGSTDGTAEILGRDHPDVRVMLGNGSLWWSGSTNWGIRESLERKCDYVLTLNQDAVVDRHMLSTMVQTAQENRTAIIGAKVYYYQHPKRIWFAGGKVGGKIWNLYIAGHGEEDHGQYDVLVDVAWLTGMGMLIEACAFRSVGLMDERAFAQHYADADFSIRAKKQGYRLLYEPRARIWHKVGDYDPKVRHNQRALREILKDFSGKHTNKNLRIVWRFYARHCPRRWLWISFPTRVLYSLVWEMKIPKW